MMSVSTTSSSAVAAAPLRSSRSTLELLAGFATMGVLVVMLAFAVLGTGRKSDTGYRLTAGFSHVDGLDVGSDVRLAGITVGHVMAQTVDPKTFQARVSFTVRPDVQLPIDTAAIITSDSLLGGKYIALSPGGDTRLLKDGGSLSETQGSISLEQLLSKFIFSVTDTLTQANKAKGAAAGAASAGSGGDLP
ncbi:outer membrane lipid asymmetry maintenance protein MlaD [Acetobacter estunensis]|uniref:outer membrane lipid asymmetry maintenance protein MlaD n=1 Tax=Acetobacter estunensis TaxID=104097 RepID=UPI001C2D6875|nr:outer membrane lipid asymmetry maintenance protein MlaD [Acetobacter estunensis]MBV1837450.1 outer membrane lipid asymmetry maintenance protein MlaD [Acetobacter estunensis]